MSEHGLHRPALSALARYCGIMQGYHDWRGTWREPRDESREALLLGLGLDVSSEEAAARELERLRAEDEESAPIAVLDPHSGSFTVVTNRSRFTQGASIATLRDERGDRRDVELVVRWTGEGVRIELTKHHEIAPGYYDIELAAADAAASAVCVCFLLVPPTVCPSVRARSGRSRELGIATNVYSLRSAANWGVGDLGDVRRTAAAAAALGVGWLGLSPLHSTANRGSGVSPYFPNDRLYFNEMYLEIAAVPEVARGVAGHEAIATGGLHDRVERLRASPYIQHAEVASLKRDVLGRLHEEFLAGRVRSERLDDYRRYAAREGEDLTLYATYAALAEILSAGSPEEPDWRRWPAQYHDPDGDAVTRLRLENRRVVDFHCWLQFELDRQLALAGEGLRLGLLADLAVGAAPGGSECWARQSLFPTSVVLGAPPDDFCEDGQAWGVAPMSPRALRRTRYHHFRRLLQANLRHSGALRIDHAMSLVRQYWVPADASPAHGAYITFPAGEMLAVVAIESARTGTVIVAEDLGTVPDGFRDELSQRGWLRTQVLYFERQANGEYSPPSAYASNSLATLNTHDLPPLRGFVAGADLKLRAQAEKPERGGATLDESLAQRAVDYAALLRRLVADGSLAEGDESSWETCAAALRLLARSRATLVGIALDDLGGEVEPVNVPGLTTQAWPLWARRMQREAADILADPNVRRLLQEARQLMDETASGG
jgi:4-alpha-glucanotransferase